MLKQLISEEEAIAKLGEAGQGVFGKRWMVALWQVEDRGEKNILSFVGRFCWRFPTGDFEKCLEMLKADMERELSATRPPVPPPLEVADWLRPKGNSRPEESEAAAEQEVEIDKLFNLGERGEP